MPESMREKAREYRLKETSTPEQLEMDGFKTISYGTETICIGYFYSPDGKSYYAATYEFTSKKKTTCEDECKLKYITPERYEDEGHALKAEIAKNTPNFSRTQSCTENRAAAKRRSETRTTSRSSVTEEATAAQERAAALRVWAAITSSSMTR